MLFTSNFLIHFELHFLKIKLVFLENNKSTCLLVVRRWESAKWQDDDETNIPIDEYSIRNGFERQNYKTTITIIAAASWIEVQLQFSSYPFFDYCHIKWHVWRIRLTLPFLIRNTDKYRYVRNDLLAKRVSHCRSLFCINHDHHQLVGVLCKVLFFCYVISWLLNLPQRYVISPKNWECCCSRSVCSQFCAMQAVTSSLSFASKLRSLLNSCSQLRNAPNSASWAPRLLAQAEHDSTTQVFNSKPIVKPRRESVICRTLWLAPQAKLNSIVPLFFRAMEVLIWIISSTKSWWTC